MQRPVRQSLQFEDQAAGDEQVEPKVADFDTLVKNADVLLRFTLYRVLPQLDDERVAVDAFEKTRSECAVDTDRAADDL